MTQPPDSDQSDNELQFDQADYDQVDYGVSGGIACGLCERPIPDSYFKVNQAIVCEECHGHIRAAREQPSGAAGRAFRALGFGLVGGTLGFAIYYGVLKLTGYQVGLISVVVGYLVGLAVRSGSNQRGGWFYQLMAIAITYCSIAATYVPFVMEGLRAENIEGAQGPTLIIVAFIFSLASPILGGFNNILEILIIGFGLYQAWQLNKRPHFETDGPFQVGVRQAEA